MKGICHHKILLERVVITLYSMQTFGAMAACFQICQPPSLNLEISVELQNLMLKFDMNIVTTGPGNINAKE